MPSKTHNFDPTTWSSSPDLQAQVTSHLSSNDLESALTHAFSLPGPPDPYIYRAIAAVTLPQAQRALSLGRANGLHRWYLRDPSSSDASSSTPATASNTAVPPTPENDLGNPPLSDIQSYTAIFSPSASPSKALTSFSSNSKRSSLRAAVGAYLSSKRFLDTDLLGGTPSRLNTKKGKSHFNPALDFWAWSCEALEWCGPCEAATRSHIAHPILPVFMHHFGCVCPSYEALEVIRLVVDRRRRTTKRKAELQAKTSAGSAAPPVPTPAIYDIGSGNGYWTWALRRHGLTVHAVDSGQSEFRTCWIDDTIHEDGARWLRSRNALAAGSEDDSVLLLVYPVVGADFTRAMLRDFRGRDVVVAGTQNANGYTGFRDMTMDEFVQRKMRPAGWRRVAQVPLPSFAGKDEALFVFSLDD